MSQPLLIPPARFYRARTRRRLVASRRGARPAGDIRCSGDFRPPSFHAMKLSRFDDALAQLGTLHRGIDAYGSGQCRWHRRAAARRRRASPPPGVPLPRRDARTILQARAPLLSRRHAARFGRAHDFRAGRDIACRTPWASQDDGRPPGLLANFSLPRMMMRVSVPGCIFRLS